MSTLENTYLAASSTEPELHLLLERDAVEDWRRWRVSGLGTIGAHAVVIGILLIWKAPTVVRPPQERAFRPMVTKLYTPPELTQKALNRTPVSKEITVPTIVPRPVLRAPAPAPQAKAGAPKAPVTRPPLPNPAPQTQPTPKPAVPEPPRIEAQNSTPQSPINQINPLQTVEKPKLVLENAAPPPPPAKPKPASGGLQPPANSVQDAIHDLARGSARAGLAVGDIGSEQGSLGSSGLNLPPSPGRPRSSLELKSDPMGVDFRPYLLQALAAVRRNWFAVYPEAARLGQRGQVILQFSIIRVGTVTKVVYTTESGSRALDQAAVAAISASNPLPPLPPEFKGDRIILQMTFLYNMPR